MANGRDAFLLTAGVNLITITARDGLQNAASVDLSVTYSVPEAPVEPEAPIDPEPPADPQLPGDTELTDLEPETPDDTQEPGPGDIPEQDDGVTDPLLVEGSDGPVTPSIGLCGGTGLIGWPLIVAGLCAIRRRAV